MPVLQGFGAKEGQMRKAMVKAGDVLTTAMAQYVESEEEFRKKFKTWFGNPTKPALADVVATMANMNGQFNRNNFTVVMGAANADENANMFSFTRAMYQDQRDQIHEQVKNWLETNPAMPMTIRPQFFDMPFISDRDQSQVETFLHELSHFAAGTIDYKKPLCYGMTGVTYCKNAGVTQAVRNAENVGFFLTSYA